MLFAVVRRHPRRPRLPARHRLAHRGPDHRLRSASSIGWSRDELAALPDVPLSSISRLLRPEHQREGCVLLAREEAELLTPPELARPAPRAAQRPRAAGVAQPLAARPAARPRRRVHRDHLGRRARRPPAADDRGPAGAARVRQPGDRRGRVGPPARAPAPPRRARPADRPAQPPRPRAADRRGHRRERDRLRARLRPRRLPPRQRHPRPRGAATTSCAASPPCCAARPRGSDVPTRLGGAEFAVVLRDTDRVARPGGRRAPAPRRARGVRRRLRADLGLDRARRDRPERRHGLRDPARRAPRARRRQRLGPRPRRPVRRRRRSACSTACAATRPRPASSSPPRCCSPRRSTCATPAPRATR